MDVAESLSRWLPPTRAEGCAISSPDARTPCFESATFHSSSVLSHWREGIYQHVLQPAQLSELSPLKPGFAVAVNDAGHR